MGFSMKKNYSCFFILVSCLLLLASPSFAHKPSDSYITLKKDNKNNSVIQAQWDIALRDLDYAIGLDDNNDGLITWGEVRKHHSDITNYALPSLKMKTNEKFCTNRVIGHQIDNHSDGAYAILNFNIDCPGENKRPQVFDLNYSLFFDLDPQHRGLLNIQHKGKTLTAIFSPENNTQHFDLNLLNPWNQFIQFIKEGIWHIWIGFDHILFLIALLLPAVLRRELNKWVAVNNFNQSFWDVFKVVTAFTLAHSITLSLAALKVIELPSRFVESAIALSVVLAAINNIFPLFKESRWIVAFLFGLIHGFGFASVLLDLGLSKNALLTSLVSFNIGVEIGQLAIVSLFLPFAYLLRKSFMYQKVTLNLGSLIIIAIASMWFTERAFGFNLLPF